MDTVESKLQQNFYTETSSNKINSSFNEKKCYHFFFPYVSTSHSVHRDFGEQPSIGQRCVIVDCKNEKTKEESHAQTFYPVNPRVFFKVPFNGDTSTYAGDFKDPAMKPSYLSTVCLNTKPYE
jgi:hypothetical protein